MGVLARLSHPIAREYFRRFDALTERGRITWVEPVMNKINALLADDRVRQLLSFSQSSFNLREIMDTGQILLIKLDKGRLLDASDLLGSLFMSKLKMAAFSRSDLPQNQRRPFYLYIDEFQNFAADSFAVVFSEARKYGLSLIMAHQTLAQVPSELRSIILGNTGIQVCFRINRQDAEALDREAFRYSGYQVKSVSLHGSECWSLGEEWEHHFAELQDLPLRCCYVKHRVQGGVIPLQTVEIEPAWEVQELSQEEYRSFLADFPLGRRSGNEARYTARASPGISGADQLPGAGGPASFPASNAAGPGPGTEQAQRRYPSPAAAGRGLSQAAQGGHRHQVRAAGVAGDHPGGR